VATLRVLLVLLAVAAAVVDNPAWWSRGYGLLGHAEWDGALLADFVAPVFLVFLGAAVPLSRRGVRASTIAAIALGLCVAGLIVTGAPRFDLATWRIPGVLQRAGVAFAIAGGVDAAAAGDNRRRTALLVSLAALILLTYWLVMAHVPVPGGTAGDLSRGGSLAAWVDRAVLGPHAWNALWDPDGILSTLSSVSTVLLGIAAGHGLSSSNAPGLRKVVQLMAAGAAATVGGIAWAPMVPVNRILWSASFVAVSTGVGAILLAAWYWSTGGDGEHVTSVSRR
jgi:predicted acyltransferase